jgi:hypothetical protein
MIKGAKTSELYVTLVVLLPWIAGQLGIDLSAANGSADELRRTIEAAHGGSDMPVWVAAAYVIGRNVVKVVQRERP